MPDLKPPRLVGDERETLLALIQYQRDSFVRKVTGVEANRATWTSVLSGTNLLWLTKHMAHAESLWVINRFAGLDLEFSEESVELHDTIDSAVALYREVWNQVDVVIAAAPSLDEVCRNTGGEAPVNLRWVLMHLLEETARHAGHADILRELIDGTSGR
jgi:hypothetical protein